MAFSTTVRETKIRRSTFPPPHHPLSRRDAVYFRSGVYTIGLRFLRAQRPNLYSLLPLPALLWPPRFQLSWSHESPAKVPTDLSFETQRSPRRPWRLRQS